jgi:hypothetical protein
MPTMPVLSVVGLNIENTTKEYIKQLMHDVLSKKNLTISINILSDPTNKFDSNAIKVLINEYPVGFIAKSDQGFFNFDHYRGYLGHIVSWGVLKDSSVYVYIQPTGVPKNG